MASPLVSSPGCTFDTRAGRRNHSPDLPPPRTALSTPRLSTTSPTYAAAGQGKAQPRPAQHAAAQRSRTAGADGQRPPALALRDQGLPGEDGCRSRASVGLTAFGATRATPSSCRSTPSAGCPEPTSAVSSARLSPSSPIAFLVDKAAGLIVLANRAADRSLGHPTDERPGMNVDAPSCPTSIACRHAT